MSPLEHELMTHAKALRQLARALVGPGDAEDLVQETALRALRSAPVVAGGLGGFFATILRRLASSHRRDARRRAAREHAAVPTEPSTADTLARGEMLQRLTAALMALPVMYREVLLQRYFEDLMPAAIAERAGVPVATVKSRLQRGLGLLRERLDGDGVEGEWRALLGSAFGLEKAAAAAAGVVLMGTGLKLAISGTAAVAVAAAWWSWSGDPGATAASPRSEAANGAPVAAEVVTDRAHSQLPSQDRREVVTLPSPSAAGNPVTVRGRCIDAADRTPLPGAVASLRIYSPDHAKDRELVPARSIGADGVFEFSFGSLVGVVQVELRADRRLRRDANLGELAAGSVVDLGDIALTAGARVRGRTVDERGRPIDRCNLSIEGLPIGVRDGASGVKAMTRSGEDGSFAFDDFVPPGVWELSAGRAGWAQVGPRSVAVAKNAADVDLIIHLAATPSIAGTVVDESGRPVARADVRVFTSRSGRYPSTQSKADGSFELFAIEPTPPPDRLEVQAEGYELLPPTPAFAWGSRDHRLVLQRGVSLDIEVVELQTQRPVEEYAVAAPMQNGSTTGRPWPMARAEHGRRTLSGLQRGKHVVAVMPRDEMLLVTSVAVDVAEGVPVARIEVERLQPLQVRVEGTDGKPIAGATVEVLHMANAPEFDNRPHDYRRNWPSFATQLSIRTDPFGARYCQVTTDADGVAAAGVLAADSMLGVRAQCQGWSACLLRQPILVPGQPLVLTLVAAASLRGRLRVTGYRDGITSLVLDAMDGSPVTKVPLAADGAFSAEGLAAGARALHFGLDLGGNVWPLDPPLGKVELHAGETTTIELDGSPFDAGTIHGRIFVNGEAVAGAKVEVSRQLITRGMSRADAVGPFVADDQGRFTATGLLPGDCSLRLILDDHGRGSWLTHEDKVTVTAGATTERNFHFVRRRLKVRVHDAHGQPVPGRRIFATLPTTDSRIAETDAAGVAVFDWMPGGTVVLHSKWDSPRSTIGAREEGKQIQIPLAQAETSVDLQLQ